MKSKGRKGFDVEAVFAESKGEETLTGCEPYGSIPIRCAGALGESPFMLAALGCAGSGGVLNSG